MDAIADKPYSLERARKKIDAADKHLVSLIGRFAPSADGEEISPALFARTDEARMYMKQIMTAKG